MDERVARRINTRRTGPGVDRFWRGLSAFADHGKLWFVAAALLMALRRPRAAFRGLLALGLASATANIVGKRVVGGDRPALTSIPVARRLQRTPTSPSFPSGHTASAVAFATAVGLEDRKAGAVLAPLAAGVGYSRLHTGAHWASDVIGGAAIGAAAAVVSAAVLRSFSPPERPRREPATAEDIALPALPDGDGAFILVNPGSGRGLDRPDPRPVLAERLPRAVVHVLAEHDDIAQLIRDARAGEHPPRVLGICGGDGTVGAVAHEARVAGLPLLVLPGGTFNHFAKAVDVDAVEKAVDALRRGTGRAEDVAELQLDGDRTLTVLNTASVGVYPAFVAEREKHERRLGKPIAAAIAAIRVVRRSDPVEVEIDGTRQRIWSVFVGVDRYFPLTVTPMERRRLDDGVLDVRVLAAGDKPRTRGAVALALGRRADALAARLPVLQGPPALSNFTATELHVTLPGDDPGYAHDGETSSTPGDPPALALRLVPSGLLVYSPPNDSRAGQVTNRADPPRG